MGASRKTAFCYTGPTISKILYSLILRQICLGQKINSHGSRRRAHHFFLAHQLFFQKNNLKKNKKFKFYFFKFNFLNIMNPVWVVEFLVFKDPLHLFRGKWKGGMYGPCI